MAIPVIVRLTGATKTVIEKDYVKPNILSGGIHQWPESERPRERLLKDGPESLSDAQLMAILLRVGRRDSSAMQVAMELLQQLGGLQGLANRGIDELCQVRGVGPAKAAQVRAAIELGKRVLSAPLSTGMRIGSSADLFKHYYPLLRDLRREIFKIILLDAKHTVIRDATVSEGSLNSSASSIHERSSVWLSARRLLPSSPFCIIIRAEILSRAREDRELTRRLVAAGELLGIQVLDHLIIGDNRYVSFADQGWLCP